ncbi:hypothetical protein Slin15195_G129710 [Septoria linicola]|uniref:Uncharacterized protein n=1 Tax=Septoria linicola TaxID=215465 RepID=A0A9Q9B9A5_9PEZI|nr:hypothetical protein Slin14017_G128730 [Septoria linicola]USW59652.1 hypothetical protein Slin15195_G129710 [Septoria linicola]
MDLQRIIDCQSVHHPEPQLRVTLRTIVFVWEQCLGAGGPAGITYDTARDEHNRLAYPGEEISPLVYSEARAIMGFIGLAPECIVPVRRPIRRFADGSSFESSSSPASLASSPFQSPSSPLESPLSPPNLASSPFHPCPFLFKAIFTDW